MRIAKMRILSVIMSAVIISILGRVLDNTWNPSEYMKSDIWFLSLMWLLTYAIVFQQLELYFDQKESSKIYNKN